jgi:ABC-2 type transport system permease protein
VTPRELRRRGELRPRRWLRGYGGFLALGVQEAIAYQVWFWLRVFTAVVAMVVAWYFWRAVYGGHEVLAGLPRDTTLRYVLLAQVLGGAGVSMVLMRTSVSLREGRIAHELLLPVDLQLGQYAFALGQWVSALASRLPLFGVLLAFGVELLGSPAVWLVGTLSFFLGASAMFFFEWLLACSAFYTTEVWGIGVAAEAVGLFFGGALLPLDFLPPWLRTVAEGLPFQQVVYVPASLWAGLTPLSEAPRVLAIQLAWVLGLGLVSRLAHARALRVVTVQGG